MKTEKKKICIFTTGLDQTNLDYAKKMLNSLHKTNPKITDVADVMLLTQQDFLASGGNPFSMRFLTPFFAKNLIKQYETVVRLDADMIITGDISHTWEGDFDVAVVQNANPREIISQQQMMNRLVSVWDIKALEEYVNCGFVVMKSEEFINHWLKLCTPERQHYQFYEQDFLNILCYYGNYKVRFLDKEGNNKWHGLIVKQYTSEIILKDKKLILPKNSGTEQDPWPTDADKEIVAYHWAGGGSVPKFSDIDSRFQPDVAEYLKFLISDESQT